MEAEINSSDDSDHHSSTRAAKRSKPNDGEEKSLDLNLDRISNLPNPLILRILSFLPTKLAAKTSILSKKWQCLWTYVPILDFDCPTFAGYYTLKRFISLINHTLILNHYPKIEKFRVEMDYRIAFATYIDAWLRFATRKNVEVLELTLVKAFGNRYNRSGGEDDYNSCYALPMNILSINSSLVTLKLINCEISHHGGGRINWTSLKVLSLSKMILSNDLILEMLSGSPSLELLELHDCWNYNFIDVKSERLRKLVIDSFDLGTVTALTISAPNIHSLDLLGHFNVEKISLINMKSLIDAKLKFFVLSGSYPNEGQKHRKILAELLENLCHVKHLVLGSCVGSWCLEVLSSFEVKDRPCSLSCSGCLRMLEEKTLRCSLSSCVCLRVDTSLYEKEIPGITRLLALTPLLETLVINANRCMSSSSVSGRDGENYWSARKSVFALALLSLKTVKITNFQATELEIELLLFLLKNASKLEKMIISAQNMTCLVSLKKSLVVAERLLSFPRCSRDAVILFC